MLEMTGSASKIEGLVQVLRESGYTILEVSRTGRMAMRRGAHTTRVLKALGSKPSDPVRPSFPNRSASAKTGDPDALPEDEALPGQFADDIDLADHEDET
jgi:acetolactate synthase-1/3 small subunit